MGNLKYAGFILLIRHGEDILIELIIPQEWVAVTLILLEWEDGENAE